MHDPPTSEELEVLTECINQGYLLPAGSDCDTKVMRSASGIPHPTYNKDVVPLRGLTFLRPDRTRLKANLALVFSAIAIIVSILSNAVEIAETCRSILCYIGLISPTG